MKVRQFRMMLDDLEAVYAAAGSKSPAKDLAAVSKAIASSDHEDFDVFLGRLEQTLIESGAKSGVAAPSAKSAADYVKGLVDAGSDEAAFNAVFEAIEADRALKNSDLDEIGEGYSQFAGFAKLFKSRKDKLQEIRNVFRTAQNYEREAAVIDELSPWQ